MKNVLISPLTAHRSPLTAHRSPLTAHRSPLVRFLMAMLLTAFLAPSAARAQGAEPPSPYDPCVAAAPSAPSCIDGSRSCYDVQHTCSPGYCWSGGVPSVNEGIPFDGVVENKVIEIGGVYTITKNVRFVNCTFRMLGDARVNISPAGNALMKIFFENCDFYGCNAMWQGIVVDVSAASAGLLFAFWGGNIEDAYIGLRLDEGDDATSYQIASNTFRNNHIGIANLRQIGGELNAKIWRNQFFQTANLAARVGSLVDDPNLPPLMPDYPLAHAGVKYVNVVSAVGVLQTGQTGNTLNVFECLVYGIVTEGGAVQSTSNIFQVMGLYGVYATDGAVRVVHCHFLESGMAGIVTIGATLKAQHNVFSGAWRWGIHASQNLNGEFITINEENQFTITDATWLYGIYVERPQALVGTHCTIDSNTFVIISATELFEFHCIYMQDFVNATDEMEISWNSMTINSTKGGVIGIFGIMGNSDQLNVHDNPIHSGTISDPRENNGIFLIGIGGQNLSNGHIIRHNTVSGINVDDESNAVHRGFYLISINAVEFCDNIVDNTYTGMHFTGSNDVALRSNHFGHHTLGLLIGPGADAKIGPQFGKGNQWDLDPDACVEFAAQVLDGDPLTSEFVVTQDNVLPWLPDHDRIDPDPTGFNNPNWFHAGGGPFDAICKSPLEPPLARAITPSEAEAILGTSVLNGVNLWDLKKDVYAKLLVFPELRPAGSPEAVFFNSLSGTALASFGQVTQLRRNALSLSAADQQTFDNAHSAIEQAFENLAALDESMDYSEVDNLAEAWFAQRLVLLQQVAANAANAAALENSREQQVNVALQNALAYNSNITAAQPYESARKTINELHIRHLLGQPMTQALYQQALTLAQQDAATTGAATAEAVRFLAPCDQVLYRAAEEVEKEMDESQKVHSTKVATLQIKPNPTAGLTEVTLPNNHGGLLTVYSVHGQKVKTLSVSSGTPKVSLDLEQVSAGLYWVVFTDETGKVFGTAKVFVAP
ncbi:MAG: T9SS type A sorting domain-containing protein [Saprospiraceae bacterium]